MIRKTLLLFTIASIMFSNIFGHEYHVSITEISLGKSGKLEISMKLFIDDFEKAIKKEHPNVYIGDDLNDKEVFTLIKSYINDHFALKSNGKAIALNFLGAEWDKDLHSFYLHMESVEQHKVQELYLYNTIFISVAPDQENMHHIKIGRKKQSAFLNRDTDSITVVIQ